MSYIHINNLYKNKDDIFLFKEVYLLEKIHGTSAKVIWRSDQDKVKFFTSEGNHINFTKLFDYDNLYQKFKEIGREKIKIYGENYGGSLQRMQDTYGRDRKFVAFDVQIDDVWLNVPNANEIVSYLGLDFVPWKKCICDIDTFTFWREQPSEQALKCGITEHRKREGIVIRPLIELRKNNDERIISKFKTEKFRETRTPRPIDVDRFIILEEANAIANEWVTEMRLTHVLQRFPKITGEEQIPQVINTMIEDIEREAEGEIISSREARRAIGRNTALLFKERLKQIRKV